MGEQWRVVKNKGCSAVRVLKSKRAMKFRGGAGHVKPVDTRQTSSDLTAAQPHRSLTATSSPIAVGDWRLEGH